ncbi:MAG: hypothetical protein QW112_01855, partial [Candidatus Micrarchaeia archaeon]
TITYNFTDLGGNIFPTHTRQIMIDKTPPFSTAIISGMRGDFGWFLSDAMVGIDVFDIASGVDKIFYDIGAGWLQYVSPVVVSEEGRNKLSYYSTDKIGWNESIKMTTIKIDKTAPLLNLVIDGVLGNAGWYRSVTNYRVEAIDTASGVKEVCTQLDGGDMTCSLEECEVG